MDYTRRQSYDLTRNHYRLTSDRVILSGIHNTENRIRLTRQHIWKSRGKPRQTFTKPLGWFIIPEEAIKTRFEDRLASGYFQSDDSTYSEAIRYIPKKEIEPLIKTLIK